MRRARDEDMNIMSRLASELTERRKKVGIASFIEIRPLSKTGRLSVLPRAFFHRAVHILECKLKSPQMTGVSQFIGQPSISYQESYETEITEESSS